jgi:DNA-binding CsgD family transcriptional regulator
VSPDLSARYLRNLELMASLPFREADPPDEAVLGRHLPFLEQLDGLGRSAISVFDLRRRTHVYTSPHYRERLGLAGALPQGPVPDSLDALIHPDDLPLLLDAGYHFLQLLLAQPPERLRHLKAIQDFRLRRADAGWTRVVEQFLLLEASPGGLPWLSLSILDVSPDQDAEAPFRARLLDLSAGEVLAFPPSVTGDLTGREREVLGLIARGLPSHGIADTLFLSVHTVNTHRQNILRKTGTANSAEAIRYAVARGLI